MSCWCGHNQWHHYGYAYPPPAYGPPAYGPPAYAPPAYPPAGYPPAAYPPPRRARRGRRARIEDLEAYLADLETELTRVREELAAHRRAAEEREQAG
jgi:hypothetical protein